MIGGGTAQERDCVGGRCIKDCLHEVELAEHSEKWERGVREGMERLLRNFKVAKPSGTRDRHGDKVVELQGVLGHAEPKPSLLNC